MSDRGPFVSVVTPFHNTSAYLEECIESVLAQSYRNFEYILVDNQSTDGSGEIAQRYARRDSRIRVLATDRLLSQVQNYNFALEQISSESRYCKVAQADDWLFPRCLGEMVTLAEANPNVAVVSSYELKGNVVAGTGLPATCQVLSGADACRLFLVGGTYMFGSPTTVMYRADVVRGRRPFYEENRLHEDTEVVFDILSHYDFGFVHQVLSYTRTQQESITGSARDFVPLALDRVILVKRYGPRFLAPDEQRECVKKALSEYYRSVARRVLKGTLHPFSEDNRRFWDYHHRGLSTVSERMRYERIAAHVGLVLLENVVNPGQLAGNIKKAAEILESGSERKA